MNFKPFNDAGGKEPRTLGASLSIVLACVACIALFACLPAAAQSTNHNFKVICPDCSVSFYSHPFKVDKSFRMESPTDRVNQYTLWFQCPNPTCTNEWSIMKERHVVLVAEEAPPALPVAPMPTMTEINQFALAHIEPGWQVETRTADKIAYWGHGQNGITPVVRPDFLEMLRTNAQNVRVIVLIPPAK